MNLSKKLLSMHEKIEPVARFNMREGKLNEELTSDRVFASFIYMVSKDGKLTNKKIHDWLVKGFVLKGKIEDDPDYQNIMNDPRGIAVDPKKLGDHLEDWNYHSHFAILDALMEKKPKNAEWLMMIADEHEKIGSKPRWLQNLQFLGRDDKFREKMLNDMEATVQGIAGKFSREVNVSMKEEVPARYWAILKKHPEKDIVARIEAMKEMEEIKPFFMSVTYASADKKERMKVSMEFNNLARKLRKEMSGLRVDVNGPWDDMKNAKFEA